MLLFWMQNLSGDSPRAGAASSRPRVVSLAPGATAGGVAAGRPSLVDLESGGAGVELHSSRPRVPRLRGE